MGGSHSRAHDVASTYLESLQDQANRAVAEQGTSVTNVCQLSATGNCEIRVGRFDCQNVAQVDFQSAVDNLTDQAAEARASAATSQTASAIAEAMGGRADADVVATQVERVRQAFVNSFRTSCYATAQQYGGVTCSGDSKIYVGEVGIRNVAAMASRCAATNATTQRALDDLQSAIAQATESEAKMGFGTWLLIAGLVALVAFAVYANGGSFLLSPMFWIALVGFLGIYGAIAYFPDWFPYKDADAIGGDPEEKDGAWQRAEAARSSNRWLFVASLLLIALDVVVLVGYGLYKATDKAIEVAPQVAPLLLAL